MSILIKGMEMPKTGEYRCVIRKWGEEITVDLYGDEELCGKLIHVPYHGRLVDADSKTFPTLHRNPSNDYMKGWNACLRSVQQQPTIIPASEEGET